MSRKYRTYIAIPKNDDTIIAMATSLKELKELVKESRLMQSVPKATSIVLFESILKYKNYTKL